jgi:hypothetical protein
LPTTKGLGEHEGYDHADKVANGLGQLEDAVDFAANGGGVEVGDQAVHTGVGGIVNTGGGAGEEEVTESSGGMKSWGEGAQPGGGTPDEGGCCEEFAAVVFIAQPTPDRVEDGADDQGA